MKHNTKYTGQNYGVFTMTVNDTDKIQFHASHFLSLSASVSRVEQRKNTNRLFYENASKHDICLVSMILYDLPIRPKISDVQTLAFFSREYRITVFLGPLQIDLHYNYTVVVPKYFIKHMCFIFTNYGVFTLEIATK